MADVETVVFDLTAQHANVERSTLSRETEIASLNLASIDIVEIIFDIEETFDISLLYNANAGSAPGGGFKTVGEVIDFVTKHLNQPAGQKIQT